MLGFPYGGGNLTNTSEYHSRSWRGEHRGALAEACCFRKR